MNGPPILLFTIIGENREREEANESVVHLFCERIEMGSKKIESTNKTTLTRQYIITKFSAENIVLLICCDPKLHLVCSMGLGVIFINCVWY